MCIRSSGGIAIVGVAGTWVDDSSETRVGSGLDFADPPQATMRIDTMKIRTWNLFTDRPPVTNPLTMSGKGWLAECADFANSLDLILSSGAHCGISRKIRENYGKRKQDENQYDHPRRSG
jgi:hypothetical protein